MIQVNNKKLVFNTLKGFHIIRVDQIVMCNADAGGSYIFLTNNEKIKFPHSLSHIEELLPPGILLRCHKSHLVNINYIKEYKYENGGIIVMSDNSKIAVSDSRRNFVINFLKQFYSENKYVSHAKIKVPSQ